MSSRRASINDIKLPPNLVKNLSLTVLKDISKQDEATFFQWFEGLELEEIKTIRRKSEQIRNTNNELALKNVDQEPRFTELKSELMLKASELKSLKEEYDKKYRELREFQSKVNPQSVQKELAQATKDIEHESDKLASDFIAGKSSLSSEEFREKFIEQRKLFWLRRVKSEKMKELLLSYRPTPSPRTIHKSSSDAQVASSGSVPPPYPSPLHSLPAQHPHSTGFAAPTASLPPYPPRSAMPVPTQPFPAAAYPSYNSAPPSRPPAYAGPGSNRHNQHRY